MWARSSGWTGERSKLGCVSVFSLADCRSRDGPGGGGWVVGNGRGVPYKNSPTGMTQHVMTPGRRKPSSSPKVPFWSLGKSCFFM